MLLFNLTRRGHVRQTIFPVSVLSLTVDLLLLLLWLLVFHLIGGSHVGEAVLPAFLLRVLALLCILDLLVFLRLIMRLRLSLDLCHLSRKAVLKPLQPRLLTLRLRLNRLALRGTLQVWTLLLMETLLEALWVLLTLRMALRWSRLESWLLLLESLWRRRGGRRALLHELRRELL